MATTPLAYNPTEDPIEGCELFGLLAVGITVQDYSQDPGGVRWWMSPDDSTGYLIARPNLNDDQPIRPGIIPPEGSLGFLRTKTKTDNDFVSLAEYVSLKLGEPQTFASTAEAKTWLNTHDCWTSYEDTGTFFLLAQDGDILTAQDGSELEYQH